MSGERYFGNTPSLSITSSKTTLDHFSAEGGISIKDSSVDITINRAGKFATDNVSKENIALFFLGAASSLVQTAQVGQTESVLMIPGLYYQLGRTIATPSGVRNITNVTFAAPGTPGTPIAIAGNFEVDLVRGRVFVEPTAPGLPVSGPVVVTYDIVASTRNIAISSNQSIYGAFRFIADNPVGNDIDYFMPYVKLSPEGDYALKGEKWQEMAFGLDILTLDSQTASVYVDGQPGLLF